MISDGSLTPSLSEVARQLDANLESGLSQDKAEKRLIKFGHNLIPKARRNLFQVYISPLLNALVNIYLVISTLLALLAMFVLPDLWGQVAFWFLFIALNAIVAIVQQVRAQKKLEALENITPPRCKVIRDGELKEIKSEEVVPGDVIKLEQGDRVPADARVIKSSSLMVNEASLTGESVPQEKKHDEDFHKGVADTSAAENMVFLGTFVTAGTATALVLETGSRTRLGAISETVNRMNTGDIPLRQKVNKLARYLASAVIVYLLVSFLYHVIYLYQGGQLIVGGSFKARLLAETAARSLITSMSIMPINIPLLTTIILLAGTLAMARQQVVIRDLSAIESLGRVSVVCTDKTGTITKNEMTVRWICLPPTPGSGHIYGVTGVGFDPKGQLFIAEDGTNPERLTPPETLPVSGDNIVIPAGSSLELLLVSGLMNNESSITSDLRESPAKKGEQSLVYRAIGDTTDAALLNLFRKSGLDENYYRPIFKETRSYPFDSNLKRMTKVFADSRTHRDVVFTKGATEIILERSKAVASNNVNEIKSLDDRAKSDLKEKAASFASKGYRVISLAFKYVDGMPPEGSKDRDAVENGLTYLGFVAIIDPPRDGVSQSVAEAKGAGVRSIMITGDSLGTARSIAGQVGIVREDDLSSAAYDKNISNQDFLRTSVFARVSPEDKLAIVERYKKSGCTVAVTGDGVNDAPALSMSDVGIAMGLTGTDVAKQSADMIIADDSFNSVVVGIREGRGLFQKIRSLIFFYIAVNAAEAIVYFGASFIPDFNLLNTWQKIYIFSTVHAIPPLAFIADRLSRDVMSEKPRDGEDIFNKNTTIALALFVAALASALALAYLSVSSGLLPVFGGNHAGFIPSFGNGSFSPGDWVEAKARIMLITVALVSETILVLSLRRLNKSVFKTIKEDSYRFIWPFLLFIPVLHLALMYFPGLQESLTGFNINLEIIRLTLADWVLVLAFALFPIALLELYKRHIRKRKSFF